MTIAQGKYFKPQFGQLVISRMDGWMNEKKERKSTHLNAK